MAWIYDFIDAEIEERWLFEGEQFVTSPQGVYLTKSLHLLNIKHNGIINPFASGVHTNYGIF